MALAVPLVSAWWQFKHHLSLLKGMENTGFTMGYSHQF
jgi:DNA-binding transcriptional regulator of glucitol operon